ncbi:MAG: thioredoxin domain-containing protein [Euryarchaeota archaeon]|nr:thioredoxin domain-containing protein [Euryarchaeota archaeon]
MDKIASKINWLEWSPEAFDRARRENKPVLARLSAVWCHWCHVQDSTSDQDDRVISRAHEKFIPVRVDIDRRPDIRERYNFGGYPTSVFLTPDAEVIVGGTYMPPDDYVKAMDYVEKLFREGGHKKTPGHGHEHGHEHHPGHEHDGEPEHDHEHAPHRTGKPALAELDSKFVTGYVMGSIRQAYDPVYGGFGMEPKFPMPETVEFLLDRYEETREGRLLQMAAETMRKIRESALWDPVEEGFFRYSVTADWSEPHYEKMLDVNAGLLLNSAHLFALTGEQVFADTARGMIDYANRNLWNDDGGFGGSQDADEDYYGRDATGRKGMAAPYIDKTIYADLDAKMISSLFAAYSYCGFEDAKIRAVEGLSGFAKLFRSNDGGLRHYHAQGRSGVTGLFSDHVFGAKAYLDGYEATGEREYLLEAERIARGFLSTFAHPSGGFGDRVPDPDEIGLLKTPQRNLSENAAAAKVLAKLGETIGDETIVTSARQCVIALLGEFERYGFHAADYARAVRLVEGPRVTLVVVGRRGEAAVEKLRSAAVRYRHPAKILKHLDSDSDAVEIALRHYEGPAIYACAGSACAAPITDSARAMAGIYAAVRTLIE